MKQQRPFRGRAKTLRDFQKDRQKKKKREQSSRKRKPKNPKIAESSEKATPSKVWTSFQRGLKWGVSVGTILLLGYIILYSPLFRVVDIQVNGATSRVLEDRIADIMLGQLDGHIAQVLPRNNILFIRPSILEARIKEDNPIVDEAAVETGWPKSISATISEKKRAIILEVRGRHIDVDSSGIAFQETPPKDLAEILQSDEALSLITHLDTSETDIRIGDRVGEETFVSFASELPQIMERFTRLEIQKISTPGIRTRELHVETAEGWLLLLDTSRSAENEIKTLNKIVEEKIAIEELEKIDYIDLRVREKTFYKLKD